MVELTMARVREFFREPEAIFWAFVFPLVLSLSLAAAFPSVADAPVLVGLGEGARRDDVRRVLQSSPAIKVQDVAPSDEPRLLRDGTVHLVVVPTDPPTYRFDAARDESRSARLVVDDLLKRAAGRADPWTATEQAVVVPGSRYVDWLIPGLVGMGLMTNGLWAVAFPIVQARMRKLLKRMVASPMRRWEFLLAQMLARMIFLVPEVALPLLFGRWALGMPFAGSLITVSMVVVVGAFSFAAIGLLMGSRARTIEAASGLVNAVQLPMWVLSGVFFSSARFPDVAQPVIHALPLTALNDALRAVILDGAGLAAVVGELAVVVAWGVPAFALALRLFRWR
jgi:ABC-2 type transport system permease protein